MDIYLGVLLLVILLPLATITTTTTTDDACKFVNDDYCFRFGQMPCYQKICECEQKNCTNVTQCVLSPWCDPSGKVLLSSNETFTPIDYDCNSLRKNCLTREKNNGYCFIYRGSCPKNNDVEAKLGRSSNEKLHKNCRRWKRKCEEKYPKHYACKQFKKKCISLNIVLTRDTNNNSSSSEENGTEQKHKQRKLEKMCSKWERKCGEKWPNHYTCRMLKKKCSFQNPVIQPITGLKSGNSTNSEESVKVKDRGKILEQCQRWKKTCARKYPEHYSCRQYRRRCKFVDAHSTDAASANSTVPASSLIHSFGTTTNSTISHEDESHAEDSDETSDLLNDS